MKTTFETFHTNKSNNKVVNKNFSQINISQVNFFPFF